MGSMSTQRGAARLDWTYGGKAYSAPLSASDVLTLAQAVDHEGAPQNGVLWALVQRWAWLRSGGAGSNLVDAYPTLGGLVRAYAQPINPRWFPNGDLHLARVRALEKAGRQQAADWEREKAERRPGYARQGWDDFKDSTVDTVGAWARGRLSNPVPGAVHYWAGSQRVSKDAHQAAKPSLPVVYYKGKKENVFFGAANTHKTRRSWVKPVGAESYVQQGPMLAGMGGISSPAAAALVGVGLIWWFLQKT